MDLRVPIPGGAQEEDDIIDSESVPLTPRDNSDVEASSTRSHRHTFSSSTSSSSSSSLLQRNKGYLSFFRSPPCTEPSLRFMEEGYTTDNRTRVPFYQPQQRNSSKAEPLQEDIRSSHLLPATHPRSDNSRRLTKNDTAMTTPCYDLESVASSDGTPRYDLESVVSSDGTPADTQEGDGRTGYALPGRYGLGHHQDTPQTARTTQSCPSPAASSSASSSARHISSASSCSSSSNKSSPQEDHLTIISSSSHLFGENLTSPEHYASRPPSALSMGSPRFSANSFQHERPWNAIWATVLDDMQLLGRAVNNRFQLIWNSHAEAQVPLSPRSRNLADLNYLTQQHKSKVQQLHGPQSLEDNHYDFCLVLQPQEVYSFWSSLLDFREELLGQEVVDTMEANWETLYDTRNNHSGSSTLEESATSSSNESEALDVLEHMSSPTGLHRRRAWSRSTPTPSRTPAVARPSPGGLYSLADCSRVSTARLSVFDRAMGESSTIASAPSPQSTSVPKFNPETVEGVRRRWGNHTVAASTPGAMSPPIRSLTRGSSTVRRPTTARPPSTQSIQEDSDNKENNTEDPNVLRMEDIPNQVIPRGIAARTNGMLAFLSALKRGIVLRRHRPGQDAVWQKMWSQDGGDTIQYQTVDYHEAMTAFKEQRVRYNLTKDVQAQSWSFETDPAGDDTDPNNHFTIPDYVAAQQYREKMSRERGVLRTVNELAKQVVRTGSLKAADIVAVHPARTQDPRSHNSKLGTSTLRRSKSNHSSEYSFSVVLRVGRLANSSIDELEDKWHTGEGGDAQFRYLDFESATEGEYWLIFRGLLLLHRDAAVGRFAEQRAAGIGSHYRRLELEQREQLDLTNDHNLLHRDEFHEPVTVGCLEKLIVKWRDLDTTYMEGFTLPGAIPPPSDYFLGFKSLGTAIWSRLRQAGLETQRVYSLDNRRVMIKIRCPSDRLMDVAEVLRLKLKTRDGTFAPFREDMVGLYQDLNDSLERSPYNSRDGGFQFRSSFRQTIIDFIIGSRIRDSGAELGQTTDLGKLIQARVPLHMPAKLDAIYRSWFYFWREENWNGRDGRSMTHRKTLSLSGDDDTLESSDFIDSGSSSARQVPDVFNRFFVGCFYQPLDSIEQYFGEKVAFYFAWLQHTASHLTFLSAAGLFMFLCQIATGKWDHPLRPFYAMVVMLWTCIVLLNWRKRANFLAYRWGTMDYKKQETTRPQFQGDYTRDEITNDWVVTYPKWKRWLKYMISFPLTLLFTTGTLLVILWVHSNRDNQLANYLSNESEEFVFDFGIKAIGQKREFVELEMRREHFRDPTFWFIVVGMPSLLGLFLPLLNFILMKLSVLLNDFENYRTESEYRSYLIIKVFSFRFVCYFATLYYYAFVSVGSQQAIENGILRVGTGVLVYTTVAQWWQNFLHVCFPIMIRKLRIRHREKRLASELREIEIEEEDISRRCMSASDEDLKARQVQLINKRLLLEQAQDDIWLELMNPQHDSFPEYIQAVVQFTFVSCFSVVLPITPLICLINYLMSMRLDAYKVCKGRRRPLAEKTGGIGVWEHLLHIVAVISILTNCWLMGFTSSQFTWIGEQVGELALFTIVVAWEHVMLLIKYIMQSSMSPLPKSVRDAMKREQYEINQQRTALMMERRLQHQREDAEQAV